MRTKFDEQLGKLNQEMIYMGTMIENNIRKSIEVLINHDVEQARILMSLDDEVDHEQKKIESMCFNLLIQQQPVAKDLRTITAAMKMVTDMERIGDHATDISEMTILLEGTSYGDNIKTISKMASETMIMLIHSVEAYVEKNINKAKDVIEHDDVIDNLFDKVKQELIVSIRENPNYGEQEINLLMVAKYLERIGDHATNIAEWVIYSLDNKIKK